MGLPLSAYGFGFPRRAYARRGRQAAAGPVLNITNLSVLSTASVGDLVGDLSVTGGTGTYTYTLTSNPGTKYAIDGVHLEVNAALVAGVDTITVRANNGAGSIIDRVMGILVTTPPGSGDGLLDYTIEGNPL